MTFKKTDQYFHSCYSGEVLINPWFLGSDMWQNGKLYTFLDVFRCFDIFLFVFSICIYEFLYVVLYFFWLLGKTFSALIYNISATCFGGGPNIGLIYHQYWSNFAWCIGFHSPGLAGWNDVWLHRFRMKRYRRKIDIIQLYFDLRQHFNNKQLFKA